MMQHVAGHLTVERLKGQNAPQPADEAEKVAQTPSKKADGASEGATKTKAQ